MSEITYISEELVMEGSLDSAGSTVVVAGRFKGEIRAKDILLESGSIFDGNLIADKACLLYTSPSPRDLSTSRMPSSA